MLKELIRQLHFTYAERHGAVALLFLAGTMFTLPSFFTALHKQPDTDFSSFARSVKAYLAEQKVNDTRQKQELFPFNPNTASLETFVQLGLSEKVARTILKYRNKGGRFRYADDLQKIYTLPKEDFERLRPFITMERPRTAKQFTKQRKKPVVELFPFDPNTAPEAALQSLGLPNYLVKRLLRYREKGGSFYEKKDFKKLYGLKEEEYKRLEPYIAIPKKTTQALPAWGANKTPDKKYTREIDINTATVETWCQLPGIGPYRAKKIVQFREKLGGFIQVGQVANSYGLPDSVFQQIKGRLKLHSAVFRKTNINTATEKALAAHPLVQYKQAKLIVAYREQHGPFAHIDQLDRILAFRDKNWLTTIKAYLTTE